MEGLVPVVRGQCNLCRFSRNLGINELGGAPCDHKDRGCNGTLKAVYKGPKRGIPQELHHVACTCDAPTLKLLVASIGGSAWTVGADPQWAVRDAKGKIEHASGVPSREQRLLHRASVLRDTQVLRELVGEGGGTLELTLVRRHADQAEWLSKVEQDPVALAGAPAEMRADPEVVMAAAQGDDSMYFLAAPSLLDDAQFVLDAIGRRGGPESGAIADGSLDWVRTAADAKLALRASLHLECPDLAASILRLKAVSKASEEERLHLALEPAICAAGDAEATRTLLRDLPREAVLHSLQRCTLKYLALGLELLDTVKDAPNMSLFGRLGKWVRQGDKAKMMALEGNMLEPGEYALGLFMSHAEELQRPDSSERFVRLLRHLEGLAPPGREACCQLVKACLAHGRREEAQQFFVAGADDSDECASLIMQTALPLNILAGLNQGGAASRGLLAKVLDMYGGPPEVLAAVAENRGSLRRLLLDAEGQELGRLPQLEAALRLAAETGAEAPGRVLLRAFAAPAPQRLPDCEVPLHWLQELRGVRGCDVLAIEKLLETLGAADVGDLEGLLQRHWTHVDWQASSQEQMFRALQLLSRLGLHARLEAASRGPREGQERQLEVDRRLTDALSALPLMRLEDPAVLCAPGLPPQAVSLLAFQRAQRAEEQARQAELKAQRLQTELEDLRRDSERRLRELRDEVQTLRRHMASHEAQARRG